MATIYKTAGTCAKEIKFKIESDGTVHDVVFTGGCNGNLKAISKMVEGKQATDVVAVLEGITCGSKLTSCADQLSKALKKAMGDTNGQV